jgi:diketogulonate reductase-like aldo/keto reductase
MLYGQEAMDTGTKVTLNNGIEMPLLGLGTYTMRRGKETEDAVLWALEAGYRLIDTATLYENERSVGRAIKKSRVPREEVFVTTKLWNDDHGYKRALAAFHESLGRLGLEYIDLYLIHWPVERLRGDSWRALETLLADGKCRAIGVSNYMIRHLEKLLESSGTVPAVNQVEFSPFLFQRGLLDFCRESGIQLQAYSPLTRGRRLRDPALARIAERYGKTRAQVLIRWALQHGVVVIPKSSHRDRIRENAEVFNFSVSPDDMEWLDSRGEDLHTDWDPTDAP